MASLTRALSVPVRFQQWPLAQPQRNRAKSCVGDGELPILKVRNREHADLQDTVLAIRQIPSEAAYSSTRMKKSVTTLLNHYSSVASYRDKLKVPI